MKIKGAHYMHRRQVKKRLKKWNKWKNQWEHGSTTQHIQKHLKKRRETPTSGCVYQGNPFGCHITSDSPIGHAQWYYCTTTIVVIQNVPVVHAHTITSVTSGQGLFSPRDWSYFRWKGPLGGIAQIPVAHAHNILPVRTVPLLVTQLPVTPLPIAHAITSGSTTSNMTL